MSIRFRDDARTLRSLSDRALVQCPRCKNQAIVRREGPNLSCASCGHHQRGLGECWAGMAKATVRRTCGRCGRRLSKTLRRAGTHPRKVEISCADCSASFLVPASWRPDPKDEPHDPHFGYRLWLQTRCAGRVLWAYNAEHLTFLRGFVEADLRERKPNSNASLASRLPKWLKSSRHRTHVLRGLDRLEAKLLG